MTNRQDRQVSRQVRADMRAENTGEAGKRCKECGKRVPQRNNQVNFACQALGYCRYCYRMNYPKRRWTLRTEGRRELETPLSTEDRLEMEQAGFNTEVWSPEFRREMEDCWSAVMRGEIRI